MADQTYISSKRTRDSTKATYKGRLKKLFEYLQREQQGHLLLGAEGISLQDLETVHVMNFLGTLGAEASRRGLQHDITVGCTVTKFVVKNDILIILGYILRYILGYILRYIFRYYTYQNNW